MKKEKGTAGDPVELATCKKAHTDAEAALKGAVKAAKQAKATAKQANKLFSDLVDLEVSKFMPAYTRQLLKPIAADEADDFKRGLEIQFGEDLNGWGMSETPEQAAEHPGLVLWQKKWTTAGRNMSNLGEERYGDHKKAEVKMTWQVIDDYAAFSYDIRQNKGYKELVSLSEMIAESDRKLSMERGIIRALGGRAESRGSGLLGKMGIGGPNAKQLNSMWGGETMGKRDFKGKKANTDRLWKKLDTHQDDMARKKHQAEDLAKAKARLHSQMGVGGGMGLGIGGGGMDGGGFGAGLMLGGGGDGPELDENGFPIGGMPELDENGLPIMPAEEKNAETVI